MRTYANQLILICLLLCGLAFAQGGVVGQPTATTAGMKFYFDQAVATACGAGTSTCTNPVCNTSSSQCLPSSAAGSAIIVNAALNASAHITSAYLCNVSSGCTSGNATATFTLVAASGCAGFSAGKTLGGDCAYILNAPAGPAEGLQYITVNLSANQANAWQILLFSAFPPAGSVFSALETAGALTGGSYDSCSTCTLWAPSLTATDLVVEFNDTVGTLPIGPVYNSPWIEDGQDTAVCLDCTTSTAPSFTFASGTGTVVNYIALKTSLGSYTPPTNTITIANHAIQGLNGPISCSPACAAFTVPSTTMGDLLRIATYVLIGSTGYISSVSGCGTWVVPATLQYGTGSGYLSMAYTLSATNACTSITITMTGSATSAVSTSYYQIHKTSGSWLLDTNGATANAATNNYPPGQALTLTNTSANHVCFQSIVDQGGISGVTYYPYTFNAGSPSAYNGETGGAGDEYAADNVLLNTISTPTPIYSYPGTGRPVTGVLGDCYY